MKGIADEPQYSVGLLEGGVALCDVIDNHIYEQTLVSVIPVVSVCHYIVLNNVQCVILKYYIVYNTWASVFTPLSV